MAQRRSPVCRIPGIPLSLHYSPPLAPACTRLHPLAPACPLALQLVAAIDYAIRHAGLSLNPAVEGNLVRVPVPKASKETRDANLKLVGKIAEEAKARVRRMRQTAMDKFKKADSGISTDVVFAELKEIQRVATEATDEITKLADKKKAEIEAA